MGSRKISAEKRAVVAHLIKQGFTNTEIAKQTGTSRCFVLNIRQKLAQNLNLGHKIGSGRPRATSQTEDRQLVRMTKSERTQNSRQLTSQWSQGLNKSVSPRTVRRRLCENNLRSYVQKRKPFRNSKQKCKRFAWCKSYQAWSAKKWSQVVFSDESHFEVVNRKSRVYVRRLPHEKEAPFNFQPRQQGGGGSVSVWGSFSAHGVGRLVVYEGRLNAQGYINTIFDALPEHLDEVSMKTRDRVLFQQDNAPCHKAKKTMQWFKDKNIDVLDWPAVSPDLNPIENLWNIIDMELHKHVINNRAALEEAIKAEWYKITPELCSKLIDSMPRRIHRVAKAKGGSISAY